MDISGVLQDNDSRGLIGASPIRGAAHSIQRRTSIAKSLMPALRLLRGSGVTRIGMRWLEKRRQKVLHRSGRKEWIQVTFVQDLNECP